jgi:transposase
MTEEYFDKLDSHQNSKTEERTETEVVAKPKRRQHTAEYKLRILRELDKCTGKGDVGAILRREGLYSSLISKWREQREQGSLNGLGVQRRGPKVDPNVAELARLRRENKRLKEKLERAELIIDVQKKVARLIGETPPPPSEEN